MAPDLDSFADWFYMKDLIIDVFSALVLITILVFAIRLYRMSKKQEKLKLLIWSFGLLSFSYLLKVASHFLIYQTVTHQKSVGVITIIYKTIEASPLLVYWGLLGYRIFFLLGLYVLYLVYAEKQSRLTMVISAYLLIALGYFSYGKSMIFYFTCLFFLVIISYNLYIRYIKDRYYKTLLLLVSFGLLSLSHLIFILLTFNPVYYVEAEIVQLVSYLFLLYAFIRVLMYGTEKG